MAGELVEFVFVAAVAEHFGGDDCIRSRRIRRTGVPLLQFAENVKTFDDAAEDGVLAIEVGRLDEREKEL